jgi:hypothetical protein
MKQLLLTATIVLATNAYIIFMLIEHSNMQVNTYNNYISVSNCYTVYVEKELKEVKEVKEPSSSFVPIIIPKFDSTSVMLQIEDKATTSDNGIFYNATAWLQDKVVFFKFFSIYSSYE